jgi:hypothetical protein
MISHISWMHPSYRDLVIDELCKDSKLRLEFLRTTGLAGIKLALSDTGGSQGERSLPLMMDNESWETLEHKCVDIIETKNNWEIIKLLEILASSAGGAKRTCNFTKISRLISKICEHIGNSWDDIVLSDQQLEAYINISVFSYPLPRLPNLILTWNERTARLEKALENEDEFLDNSTVSDWADLLALISTYEPRFLIQIDYPKAFNKVIDKLMQRLSEELDWKIISPSPDEIQQEFDRYDDLGNNCKKLSLVLPTKFSRTLGDFSREYELKAEEMGAMLQEEQQIPEPDYEPEDYSSNDFDIKALFVDL